MGIFSELFDDDKLPKSYPNVVGTSVPAGVDPINHPPHYTSHPSGVECIQITEHMGFNLGNAIKYIWRADEKGSALEDLRKAEWYVKREIERRERQLLEREVQTGESASGDIANCRAGTSFGA